MFKKIIAFTTAHKKPVFISAVSLFVAVVLMTLYLTSWRTFTVTFDPNVPPNTRLTFYRQGYLYTETPDILELWALNDINPLNVKINNTIKPPNDPYVLNKDILGKGYKFIGWHTDKQCTNSWSFYADKVTKNMTLYAKWEEK